MGKLINLLKDWFKNLSGERHRLTLICLAGFSVLLIFLIIMSVKGSGREKKPGEAERVSLNIAIPVEELFIPDEPDFLPGVLLERDRRSSWTEQDALEYWRNPLISGEEEWRKKIESAVDELLESIP